MRIFIRDSKNNIIPFECEPLDTIKSIKKKFKDKFHIYGDIELIYNGNILEDDQTIDDCCIQDSHTLEFIGQYKAGGGYSKEINIKFIKSPKDTKRTYCSEFNFFQKKNKEELYGLLKLCLLKEISSKVEDDAIIQLPELLSYILQILKNGCIFQSIAKEEIKMVLNKIRGSNILNFSKYVDHSINQEHIKILFQYLKNKELEEITDIQKSLLNYNEFMKLFEKDFEERKKNSVFEFSIISLVVMEREDFQLFEKERKNCPNRVDRILYHGTSIEPISCILTGYFKKSIDRCYQHGKGVYFTDTLDYCWFYGGEKSNRANGNKIPKIGETFTFIANAIYYDKNGYRKVKDYKYTPKKNEINFAYAKEDFSTIEDYPNKNKFYGTEYVIYELAQICPFIGAKLKRKEFCVIWRDNNFSTKAIYNNQFDAIFKKFLKERMIYVEQYAEFNIYPCEASDDALELVKRKKYNKIILISNVGSDLGGQKFIDEARKIIGNDVISLFLAYNIQHLQWIKDYKNALFSNEPNFYEEYLSCFSDDDNNYYSKEEMILMLKEKMENHYKIKFNFNDKFLYFPKYKEGGKYIYLIF